MIFARSVDTKIISTSKIGHDLECVTLYICSMRLFVSVILRNF